MSLECGGLVPKNFTRAGRINSMYFPRLKVRTLEDGTLVRRLSTSVGESAPARGDRFLASVPKDLTLQDCLVADFEEKTIFEQRRFFQKRMREMSRIGHDAEDGWVFKGKTQASNAARSQQLDVYERAVAWATVKQMRTIVETSLSCDRIFEHLRDL